MKTKILTKICFYTILFGWFGFMWLCGWGWHQPLMIRLTIVITLLFLCLVGSVLILPILMNDSLFKSMDELDDEKFRYQEATKRLEKKIKEL
jgi:hypothetical protein